MTPLRAIFREPFYRAAGIRLEIDPHDLWWGLFWKRRRWPTIVTGADHPGWQYHVYVCFVPCLPVHVWFVRRRRPTVAEFLAQPARQRSNGRAHPEDVFLTSLKRRRRKS